jgi:hypothetical protein
VTQSGHRPRSKHGQPPRHRWHRAGQRSLDEPNTYLAIGDDRADHLVIVWRLVAAGRAEEARRLLIHSWCQSFDVLSTDQEGRVAVRLFDRLGFSTDDPELWHSLPDPVPVYRFGSPGVSWTADREIAEEARRSAGEGAPPIQSRAVAKTEALAFITGYGEQEVIVRPSPR